jgi:hypothetical protein
MDTRKHTKHVVRNGLMDFLCTLGDKWGRAEIIKTWLATWTLPYDYHNQQSKLLIFTFENKWSFYLDSSDYLQDPK